MSRLQRWADRLVLQPSTHPIESEHGMRQELVLDGDLIEYWSCQTVPAKGASSSCPRLLAIKFPGAGGRAERGTQAPFHLWKHHETEIWTVNHRGYGGSSGHASLQNFSATCDAIGHHASQTHPDRPLFVYGNSLGCLSALYLTSRMTVAGIYLRNPPPLAWMIATRPRYAWTSLGLSRLIARQVPKALDSIENATRCRCPALFVQSEKDRVIPPRFQNAIVKAYAGEKRSFLIPDADHHHRIPDELGEDYMQQVKWLLRAAEIK